MPLYHCQRLFVHIVRNQPLFPPVYQTPVHSQSGHQYCIGLGQTSGRLLIHQNPMFYRINACIDCLLYCLGNGQVGKAFPSPGMGLVNPCLDLLPAHLLILHALCRGAGAAGDHKLNPISSGHNFFPNRFSDLPRPVCHMIAEIPSMSAGGADGPSRNHHMRARKISCIKCIPKGVGSMMARCVYPDCSNSIVNTVLPFLHASQHRRRDSSRRDSVLLLCCNQSHNIGMAVNQPRKHSHSSAVIYFCFSFVNLLSCWPYDRYFSRFYRNCLIQKTVFLYSVKYIHMFKYFFLHLFTPFCHPCCKFLSRCHVVPI